MSVSYVSTTTSLMKKPILLLSFLFLALAIVPNTQAQIGGNAFGAGVIFGEPTGLSAKWFRGNDRALDLAVAWSTGRFGSLHVHGDYLIHRYDLISVDSGKLPVYYGIGARMRFADNNHDSHLGIRVPVGLAYQFANDPFEIFFEVVPVIDLMPGTGFDANGGFGVRYYFGRVNR